MMTRWKVSYHLATPIAVSNPVAEYPELQISLIYDPANNLIRVDHQLNTEDYLTADSVVMISQVCLKLFWELMHFWRGLSLQVHKHSVELLDSNDSKVAPCTNRVTIQSEASICRSIVMPKAKVFTNPNCRLLVWLRLANEARSAPSSADAIRKYYMIWEDIHGTPADTNAPKEALELKYVRDFVSHGKRLNNCDLLKFLEEQFGRLTAQYDPTDRSHQNLVEHYRKIGRTLIESKLECLITETA